MKPRIFIVTALFVAAGLAAWWSLRPAANTGEKPAAAPASTSADAPKPVPVPAAVPTRVELPKTAFPASLAAATPSVPSAAPASPTSPGVVDRGDLNSIVPECVRLLEAQDLMGVIDILMPPEARTNLPPGRTIEQMIQDPGFVSKMADLLVGLKAINGQMPTLSEAGDRATYKLDPPVRSHNDITFVKIDGNWYLR